MRKSIAGLILVSFICLVSLLLYSGQGKSADARLRNALAGSTTTTTTTTTTSTNAQQKSSSSTTKTKTSQSGPQSAVPDAAVDDTPNSDESDAMNRVSDRDDATAGRHRSSSSSSSKNWRDPDVENPADRKEDEEEDGEDDNNNSKKIDDNVSVTRPSTGSSTSDEQQQQTDTPDSGTTKDLVQEDAKRMADKDIMDDDGVNGDNDNDDDNDNDSDKDSNSNDRREPVVLHRKRETATDDLEAWFRLLDNDRKSTLNWAGIVPTDHCAFEERVGAQADGGKFTCNPRLALRPRDCVVYSFGSNAAIDFEQQISEIGKCEIHIFDPTPGLPDQMARLRLPRNTTFHPLGIHGVHNEPVKIRGKSVEVRSLESIVNELGHRRIDILKIDVEGSEWDIFDFDNEAQVSLWRQRFGQLLIEIHLCDHFWLLNAEPKWNGGDRFTYFRNWLIGMEERFGYRLVHVEMNMYAQSGCSWELAMVNSRWRIPRPGASNSADADSMMGIIEAGEYLVQQVVDSPVVSDPDSEAPAPLLQPLYERVVAETVQKDAARKRDFESQFGADRRKEPWALRFSPFFMQRYEAETHCRRLREITEPFRYCADAENRAMIVAARKEGLPVPAFSVLVDERHAPLLPSFYAAPEKPTSFGPVTLPSHWAVSFWNLTEPALKFMRLRKALVPLAPWNLTIVRWSAFNMGALIGRQKAEQVIVQHSRQIIAQLDFCDLPAIGTGKNTTEFRRSFSTYASVHPHAFVDEFFTIFREAGFRVFWKQLDIHGMHDMHRNRTTPSVVTSLRWAHMCSWIVGWVKD